MVFNLYFDNKYCQWAPPLIKSIRIYEPTAKIFIHAYNLSTSQKSKIENLKVDAFECEDMLFNPKISDAYFWKNPLKLNDQIQLRFQITCRKGEYLLKSIKKFPQEELHIVMDVDTLLIRPLLKLRKQMKQNDVGIILVAKDKVMGTFFVARNTKNGRRFLKTFNRQVMNSHLYLCKDQKTLAKVYYETRKEIRFKLLTRQYLDPSSHKNAFIWSAHKTKYGPKKKRLQKYISYINAIEDGLKTT